MEYYERILLKAKLERQHQCPIWETASGELIPITAMNLAHMRNAWAMMVRNGMNEMNTLASYKSCLYALAMLGEEFKRRNEAYPEIEIQRLVNHWGKLLRQTSQAKSVREGFGDLVRHLSRGYQGDYEAGGGDWINRQDEWW